VYQVVVKGGHYAETWAFLHVEAHGRLEAEGDAKDVDVGAEGFVVESDTMGLHTAACNADRAGTAKGPSIHRRDDETFDVHSSPAIPGQAFEVASVVA
jgi:hypothetical protein